jgi:hypothetical protein
MSGLFGALAGSGSAVLHNARVRAVLIALAIVFTLATQAT